MSERIPAPRADIYTRLTAEILTAIEIGAGEWRMPWHHNGTTITRPTNLASGKRYRGINVLALWIAASTKGYSDGLWGTYRQWQAAGAQVRKGERSSTVVLWKELRSRSATEDTAEDGSEEERPRLVACAFNVFNRAQVDDFEMKEPPPRPEPVPIAQAGTFFAALGIAMTEGPHDAHYRINEDRIYMPPLPAFRDAVAHAGTLFHEAAHATGAKHRLDRNFSERFGPSSRAMEEAVAELTASYILADLGVAHHPRPDHAAYIASWMTLLKDDPRAIFTAASKAQQAADWMHTRQPQRQAAA